MNKEDLTYTIYSSRDEMGRQAALDVAKAIKEELAHKDEIGIIFAAAPSQNEFLAALVADTTIPWERINAFHMDEYIGLPADAPQGFGNFLADRIFKKVPFKSVHYITSNAADPDKTIEEYTAQLKNNSIDITCMGIGENAHIAFNDPHVADFNDPKLMKIVDLDMKCRTQQVHDGCFKTIDEVPTQAFTLTIPVLMNSKHVFCMVPSATKAQAVYNTINAEITEKYPSTIMRRKPGCRLYLDPDSASLL